MNKPIWLVYARRSKRHNWRMYGRNSSYQGAINNALSLLKDCKTDKDYNWQIKIVCTYKQGIDFNQIDNLKSNTNFYDLGLIPHGNMQSKPDQTVYNGGN